LVKLAVPAKARTPMVTIDAGMTTLLRDPQFSNAWSAMAVVPDAITACSPQVPQLAQGIDIGCVVGSAPKVNTENNRTAENAPEKITESSFIDPKWLLKLCSSSAGLRRTSELYRLH
jgi:hypothetical protein